MDDTIKDCTQLHQSHQLHFQMPILYEIDWEKIKEEDILILLKIALNTLQITFSAEFVKDNNLEHLVKKKDNN